MKRALTLALALSVVLSTMVSAQGKRDENAIQYSTSIGIGTSLPFNPDEFNDGWDPSFGFMIDVGAALQMVEVAANIDYSFFLSDSQVPDDVNVYTMFLNVKIKPLKTAARPYIFAGAGYFRYWIVDLDVYENTVGFGGGAGLEFEIDDSRRIFLEGKTLHGRTRETARRANLEIIPIRVGITFTF